MKRGIKFSHQLWFLSIAIMGTFPKVPSLSSIVFAIILKEAIILQMIFFKKQYRNGSNPLSSRSFQGSARANNKTALLKEARGGTLGNVPIPISGFRLNSGHLASRAIFPLPLPTNQDKHVYQECAPALGELGCRLPLSAVLVCR